MAKIVVPRSQQLIMAEEHPRPYYSRVIGLTLTTGAPPWEGFVQSPVIGNNVWLLNVKIWVFAKPIVAWQETSVQIYAMAGGNVVYDDLKNMEHVMPITDMDGMPKMWHMYDGQEYKEFTMKRFFSGQQRRFALGVRRTLGDADRVQAALEISEG